MRFVFTNKAKKQFNKLDIDTQTRIRNKLILIKADNTLLKQNIKQVINIENITHRLRIGSYRLLLNKDSFGYIVLKVSHRANAYK